MVLRKIRYPIQVFIYSRIFYFVSAYFISKAHKLDFSNKLFCQWDCSWYLTIVHQGYMPTIPTDKSFAGQANWAFFPVMPYLVRVLSSLTRIPVLPVAYIVSNISLLIALIYLYKYLSQFFSERIAKTVIILMAISPVNVYFMSLYTEAIYLALLISTVYYVRRHEWITAGILGAFLGATRNTGIFVILIYLLEFRNIPLSDRTTHRLKKFLIGLVIFPSGFLMFMVHLKLRTGDPLAFYHIQSTWGPIRGNPFYLTFHTLSEHHFSETFNLLILFLACFSCIAFFVKKRFTEFLVLLPVTLTSIYSSRDNYRFFLAIYPMYIILAKLINARKSLMAITLVLEILLLFFYISKWITGYGPY